MFSCVNSERPLEGFIVFIIYTIIITHRILMQNGVSQPKMVTRTTTPFRFHFMHASNLFPMMVHFSGHTAALVCGMPSRCGGLHPTGFNYPGRRGPFLAAVAFRIPRCGALPTCATLLTASSGSGLG